MSLDLPSILDRYFAAQNAHDIEAMVACFAPDAAVRDEGHDVYRHGGDPRLEKRDERKVPHHCRTSRMRDRGQNDDRCREGLRHIRR